MEESSGQWSVWCSLFLVRQGYRSSTSSDQLFAKYWQQANHIQEWLPPKKAGIDIAKAGKLCWIYNCYKRHGEPWDVKEVGDIDDIRHRIGNLLFPSRESLGFAYSVKVAAKYEEAWSGDQSLGNEYIMIVDLCVTTVPMAHDDWGRVGGSATEKITSWYFYSFCSLLSVELGWNLISL